jgi:hypothetical protein
MICYDRIKNNAYKIQLTFYILSNQNNLYLNWSESYEGHKERVELLINKGIDLNERNNFGENA